VIGPIADPVEWTPRRDLDWSRLLWVAVVLSPRLEICEALVSGIPVPARRLDFAWVQALDLANDIVLNKELALRVAGHGPLLGKAAA
jgi:hypothetical protein